MDVLARCERPLIGQGSDTWDPNCWRPKGHDGKCMPAGDWAVALETQLAGAVEALREIEGKLSDATRSTRHGNSGVANTLVAEALTLIRERGR